jgi:hypothetical protein
MNRAITSNLWLHIIVYGMCLIRPTLVSLQSVHHMVIFAYVVSFQSRVNPTLAWMAAPAPMWIRRLSVGARLDSREVDAKKRVSHRIRFDIGDCNFSWFSYNIYNIRSNSNFGHYWPCIGYRLFLGRFKCNFQVSILLCPSTGMPIFDEKLRHFLTGPPNLAMEFVMDLLN